MIPKEIKYNLHCDDVKHQTTVIQYFNSKT